MEQFAKLVASLSRDGASFPHIRRDLHAHPELRFEEHRTSGIIGELLSSWGITVHRNIGGTGVVGVLRSETAGGAIGLRADMDALPITELNTFAHASTNAGAMHACGHDGHTTMLLAAAHHLSKHRDFAGTVYFIFQPAEEGAGGALAMIRDGLFDRFPMDAIFGLHNWPGLPVGAFALKEGPVFASGSRFTITIEGAGSHAALPHDGVDPVPIACQIVQALQTIISRNKRATDTGILSVTRLQAGEAINIIPSNCTLQGTVRTFELSVLDMIERRMGAIVNAICEAFEARGTLLFERYCAPTINAKDETAFVTQFLSEMVGSRNVRAFEPTMGSEDFSEYLQFVPGCFFMIGNGGAEDDPAAVPGCVLHNASYDFNDDLIPLGAAAWVKLVERRLPAISAEIHPRN